MTQPRPVKRWPVLIAAGIGTAILLSLSYWQYSKIAPKDAQIAMVKERMALPAAPLPKGPIALEEWRYRPAAITGIYRADLTRHVYRAGKNGRPGYHLLVPVERRDASEVWVDLGWFDETRKADFETVALPNGPQQIAGRLVPRQRDPKWITPAAPDPSSNRYYRIQPDVLGAGADLAAQEDVYLLSSTPLEGLVATVLPIKLEHNHRSYAFQWLAMAIALVVIAGAFLRRS